MTRGHDARVNTTTEGCTDGLSFPKATTLTRTHALDTPCCGKSRQQSQEAFAVPVTTTTMTLITQKCDSVEQQESLEELGTPKKAHRRLSLLRVAATMVLLLALLSMVIVLVRALPATVAGYVAAGFLGIAVLPIIASPLEWWVHRYVYHRKLIPLARRIYVIHHQGHHHAIFPTRRY